MSQDEKEKESLEKRQFYEQQQKELREISDAELAREGGISMEAVKNLSKKGRKKLIRFVRNKEKRTEKRRLERQRRRKRLRDERTEKQQSSSSSSASSSKDDSNSTNSKRQRVVSKIEKDAVRLCVDCSFDDKMAPHELRSLQKQLAACHSANKSATRPSRFHVCGMSGPAMQRFKSVYTLDNWTNFEIADAHYGDVFDADDLVYLSSESDTVLDAVDKSKVYVIGGIVDKNRHKGMTHRLAVERGIATARLPIDEHLDMATRRVLTVNHVFEIMLRRYAGQQWPQLLLDVIPARKQATNKKEKEIDDN
jgi:tRNA (guanine9-N1)-methyltransferase